MNREERKEHEDSKNFLCEFGVLCGLNLLEEQ